MWTDINLTIELKRHYSQAIQNLREPLDSSIITNCTTTKTHLGRRSSKTSSINNKSSQIDVINTNIPNAKKNKRKKKPNKNCGCHHSLCSISSLFSYFQPKDGFLLFIPYMNTVLYYYACVLCPLSRCVCVHIIENILDDKTVTEIQFSTRIL